jgi:hypothetical protein
MRKKHLEVYRAALKIAGSGKAHNWKGVQDKLVDGGYPRAPEFLDSQKIRAILDMRCEEVRRNAG